MNIAQETSFALSAEPLCIQVRRGVDGPVVAQERVTRSDLALVLGEMWLAGYLRRGCAHVPFEEINARLVLPGDDGRTGSFPSYAVEATNQRGETTRRSFSLQSLQAVGRRALHRHQDEAQPGEPAKYYFGIVLATSGQGSPQPPEDSASEIQLRRAALRCLTVPLEPLLAQAHPVHPDNPADAHVFYTQSALAKAARCARRGAGRSRPVETGGLLVGSLCASPCGEFFVVVSDVIEAVHAEATTYSLELSGLSWDRIHGRLANRQAAAPERALRLLGNCHGHNFLPNLVPTADDPYSCNACAKRDTCPITSVFVSSDDQAWSQAVFAQQPWQLTHIFGLTPRGEPVHGLFGLRDGRLQSRGFRVLPDFQPNQWSES